MEQEATRPSIGSAFVLDLDFNSSFVADLFISEVTMTY